MKRPKLPQLRTPKKYRDGKVLTAVVKAFEENLARARTIENIPARFKALTILERKAQKQVAHIEKALWTPRGNQSVASLSGALGTGIAAGIFLGLGPGGAIVGVPFIVVDSVLRSKDEKNKATEGHPRHSLVCLGKALTDIRDERTAVAMSYPAELAGTPAFDSLCENNPALMRVLSEAFRKGQQARPDSLPQPAPDLTAALSKPRLPQVKR